MGKYKKDPGKPGSFLNHIICDCNIVAPVRKLKN
jgi:hypothetical protein